MNTEAIQNARFKVRNSPGSRPGYPSHTTVELETSVQGQTYAIAFDTLDMALQRGLNCLLTSLRTTSFNPPLFSKWKKL